ncbi:MAG: hypothetical protein IT190_10800, partial [Microbacteriaceae bacterium]|nr:hypothetical protein [Microbacteriaceae bacterium]
KAKKSPSEQKAAGCIEVGLTAALRSSLVPFQSSRPACVRGTAREWEGREGLSRDDLRSELRKGPAQRGSSARKRPFAFKFRAPDKSFQLQLQFRQSTVEKSDLIRALEQILDEIRNAPEA